MDSSTEQQHKCYADLKFHSFSSWHSNNEDKDNVADNNTVNHIVSLKEFLELPDKLFYDWLRIRLNIPVLEESNQVSIEEEREYFTNSFTIDQIFSEISRLVEIVTIGGKEIKVRKYYNRALQIVKFVNLTKQDQEFVINISDLSPRIIAELKTLSKLDADYILKQAVGGIFENINSKRYHSMGFAKEIASET
jgi:hypothetical protein